MVVELEWNLNIWYIYKGGLSDHNETLVMGNEMLVSGERGVREQVGGTRTWQTKTRMIRRKEEGKRRSERINMHIWE